MLYFFGFIILLIIILILIRKQLRLRLIRTKHGRYSYHYIKQFKKYANKSPFPYCFKDEILPYLRLSHARRENTEQLSSDLHLLFEETPYHTPLHEIMDKLGNPDYFNAFKIKNSELRALGFQKQVYGLRVKVVFFFLNEFFVMGEYIFDDVSGIDVPAIAKKLMEQTGTSHQSNLLHFYIDGKNNSSIYFYDNGFSLIIRYSDLSNQNFLELIQ